MPIGPCSARGWQLLAVVTTWPGIFFWLQREIIGVVLFLDVIRIAAAANSSSGNRPVGWLGNPWVCRTRLPASNTHGHIVSARADPSARRCRPGFRCPHAGRRSCCPANGAVVPAVGSVPVEQPVGVGMIEKRPGRAFLRRRRGSTNGRPSGNRVPTLQGMLNCAGALHWGWACFRLFETRQAEIRD